MNQQLLLEMALSRLDAMDRCIDYGEKFCEHFNIICKEGINSANFKHHCGELQGWFKIVSKIKFKHNSKPITDEDLIDWFFTASQTYEDVIDSDYLDVYKKFIQKLLLRDNQLISDILIELLS